MEIENAAQKIDLKEAVRIAYRNILNDELVRERIRSATQVVQFQIIQEKLEENKKELPAESDDVKKLDKAILEWKKEELQKKNLLKQLRNVLNDENIINRIITVLEETE